ncbi:hypothetical protein, partial [Escherichia coli]|uniref:hypothetical protein n=1 Tax=Escherichia coli TaxID=562 RepID=UPI003078C6E9
MTHYDTALKAACQTGCTADMISPQLKADHSHAIAVGNVGIGMFVGAGIVMVAGGVLAVLNAPVKKEESKITPTVNATDSSVTMGISF